MNCTAANSLWFAACLPDLALYHRAGRNVAGVQRAILRRILASNKDTEFGRSHGFASVRTVREFQERAPLRDYESYRESIERTAAGASNQLTREPVRLFEPSSGSTSAAKLIPYTGSFQREFQAGIRPWIADLFLHDSDLLTGTAYWSVSPVMSTHRKTPGGIPIGFEDDTSYLGGWQSKLVESVMAVPASVRFVADLDAFRYATLYFLIRRSNLKLFSVWNPSFLTLLVNRLPEFGEELAWDLQRGTIRSDISLPRELRESLQPAPRRAQKLRAALRSNSAPERHLQLWPELRLISCWADANAAGAARQLASLFPHARLQPKGLVATEGFVSFPLTGHDGAALSVRSHFLEFLPADSSGHSDPVHPRLAHELEFGQTYSVVLTTGGGLYRYRLDDLVQVVGRLHDCPLVRFLGREGYVADWFGEKLNEAHVSRILQETFETLKFSPCFAMLGCDTSLPIPAYVLYIDSAEPDELLLRAAKMIELSLSENFHYQYARRLGQLAPLRVFRAEHAAETYRSQAQGDGQRAGGIKPLALDRRTGWSRTFRGCFSAEVIAGQ